MLYMFRSFLILKLNGMWIGRQNTWKHMGSQRSVLILLAIQSAIQFSGANLETRTSWLCQVGVMFVWLNVVSWNPLTTHTLNVSGCCGFGPASVSCESHTALEKLRLDDWILLASNCVLSNYVSQPLKWPISQSLPGIEFVVQWKQGWGKRDRSTSWLRLASDLLAKCGLEYVELNHAHQAFACICRMRWFKILNSSNPIWTDLQIHLTCTWPVFSLVVNGQTSFFLNANIN